VCRVGHLQELLILVCIMYEGTSSRYTCQF